MPSRTRQPLSSAESRRFWREAFDAGTRLLKPHDGKRIPTPGAAHYAADFADAALEEFRLRWGKRP